MKSLNLYPKPVTQSLNHNPHHTASMKDYYKKKKTEKGVRVWIFMCGKRCAWVRLNAAHPGEGLRVVKAAYPTLTHAHTHWRFITLKAHT